MTLSKSIPCSTSYETLKIPRWPVSYVADRSTDPGICLTVIRPEKAGEITTWHAHADC